MQQQNFKEINLIEGRQSRHYWVEEEQMLYSSYSARGDTRYLKCIEEHCTCKGKIGKFLFSRTGTPIVTHDHDNHAIQAEYEMAFEGLREAVRSSRRGSIRSLHAEALRGLSQEASGLLAWSSKCRTLQRIRHDQMPPCSSLEDLGKFLEDDNSTVNSTYGWVRDLRFYQGTVGGHLVFANLLLIESLGEIFDMAIDGTFGVTPFHARQLLIILGEVKGRLRPIFYIIMQGQTTEDYKQVLEHVQSLLWTGSRVLRRPGKVMCDFEQALRNAIKDVFDVDANGCNFHFCQANRRNARKVKEISALLFAGTQHHQLLTMFLRLSLLPVNRMMAGFEGILGLLDDCGLAEDFGPYVEYFRRTWLQLYPAEDWCVGDLDRRSNNTLEGYNHKVKLTIPENPTPWQFLDGILDLAFDAISEYLKDLRTDAAPPADRSSLTQPLNAALAELNSGALDELGFLKKLASWRD